MATPTKPTDEEVLVKLLDEAMQIPLPIITYPDSNSIFTVDPSQGVMKVGDYVSYKEVDTRWYMRFLSFLINKPITRDVAKCKVTKIISESVIEVKFLSR